MKRRVFFLYILASFILVILSYGFLDVNLTLTKNRQLQNILLGFNSFFSTHRPFLTMLWLFGLSVLSVIYIYLLKNTEAIKKESYKFIGICIFIVGSISAFSYPANSYDLFNYITTAKVSFHYKENPYIVMPIEFIEDPYLSFTRAANKIALYGPVWIFFSAIPHFLGAGNIWATIVAFKLMNTCMYLLFLYGVLSVTRSMKNVIFFAFNPLVVIEVLINGHNDIYMMIFSLFGMYSWWHTRKIIGFLSLIISWFIKGMTIVLLPLFFLRKKSWERILRISYWTVLTVFIIAAPIREELYPWYAVWIISIASLIKFEWNRFIYELTIVLSLSLELRHIPYMWMGYYEGVGPMLRILVTIIPVVIYLTIHLLSQYKRVTVPRI